MDGTLSTFLQPAGRSNGMYFDSKGNLLACAEEKRELRSIAPDGTRIVRCRLATRVPPPRLHTIRYRPRSSDPTVT